MLLRLAQLLEHAAELLVQVGDHCVTQRHAHREYAIQVSGGCQPCLAKKCGSSASMAGRGSRNQ